MKVILTENAEENLWQIYKDHSDYSIEYADKAQCGFSPQLNSVCGSYV